MASEIRVSSAAKELCDRSESLARILRVIPASPLILRGRAWFIEAPRRNGDPKENSLAVGKGARPYPPRRGSCFCDKNSSICDPHRPTRAEAHVPKEMSAI